MATPTDSPRTTASFMRLLATDFSTTRNGSVGGGKTPYPRVVPIIGQKIIDPDPNVVDAFKNIGYSIEAAVADLVDNSIDAGADLVLIRFVRSEYELLRLAVVDNGQGMSEATIDRAMQFGGQRPYREGDLGMYGMGLKSASLSQADSVTVLSRAKGRAAVGRRWTEAQAKAGWKCDIVERAYARDELGRGWHSDLDGSSSGTIVMWDEVRDFQKATDRVDAYLRRVRLAIGNHLGLQLHRFLETGLRILIDTENIETDDLGMQTAVVPLNPFSYPKTGKHGYPKEFELSLNDASGLSVVAHIWPARSHLPGYKLGGGAVSRRQGFYFYRNDRLIQAGGWNNLRDDAEPHLSLARVVVNLPAAFESFFSVRFNKQGVDAPRSFVDAAEDARATDGTTFPKYIEDAIHVYRSRGEAKLPSLVPPGRGLRAEVRKEIRRQLPVLPKEDAIDIVWRVLPEDRFFLVDRDNAELVLNARFRDRLIGSHRASAADAPLIKALMYLLLNKTFRTQRESKIERATLRAYEQILLAAVEAERE
jgi:hypothetical protein